MMKTKLSLFTLALVHGLSVEDTSKHAVANLGWREITLPAPVAVVERKRCDRPERGDPAAQAR